MCQCANTTAGCEHHKQRKQKQQNRNNKTQHRIFILCHPLPFRSIAVCIGVRTAILHRCSHLAVCTCVRTCVAMANANKKQVFDRYIPVDPEIKKAVLYAVDTNLVKNQTGVAVRVKPCANGMMLKLHWTGVYPVPVGTIFRSCC